MRMTRVTNQAARAPAAGSARIRVIAGPDRGQETLLSPVGIVVGGGDTSDWALSDETVSSRHCAIVPKDEGFHVSDLGSRNGTRVDGVAIDRAQVPMGAVLRLGRTLLQLLPAEERVEIPPSEASQFVDLVGGSAAMRQVFGLLERASPSDASVLFIGESGTGKELAARAVHARSTRRDGPFVVFDCGAASDTLVASDLFGHVRGAFTGADRERQGAFAAAHGGTLFLDEIGDLPLELQPKLLRLLESGEVTPLGSNRAHHFDVRVVAATHHDLWAEVARGTFRGDLYYRLAVVEIHLPPLRQRIDDVPALTTLFLQRAGMTEEALEASPVTGPNLDRLQHYQWPGNVRELRNVVARAVALGLPGAPFAELPILLGAAGAGPVTTVPGAPVPPPAAGRDVTGGAETIPETGLRADRSYHEVKAEVLARFERAYLSDLLERSGGNLSEAARQAGVERKHLYTLLKRAGLR